MKRIIIIGLFFSIWNAGCKKEQILPPFTVEVVDYITGRPIEGALVKRRSSIDTLGLTDKNGQLRIHLNFERIVINKYGYLSAWEFNFSIAEKTENFFKFHLFKQAQVMLTTYTSQNYNPRPYVETGPLLRDGSMKVLNDGVFTTTLQAGNGFLAFMLTGGDMQNRILVLKRDNPSSTPDTLFKTDIFIPANTAPQVTVNY